MNLYLYIIAPILILSALGVVVFRNPIHSGLALVTNLIGVATLYAALDANFLAVVQIVVYAGAVMVLVLFVLMLINIKEELFNKREKAFVYTAVFFGVFFFLGFMYSIGSWLNQLDTKTSRYALKDNSIKINSAKSDSTRSDEEKVMFSKLAKALNLVKIDETTDLKEKQSAHENQNLETKFDDQLVIDKENSNQEIVFFGQELFKKYLLPFELSSFLLIAALIGATMLAESRKHGAPSSSSADGSGNKL